MRGRDARFESRRERTRFDAQINFIILFHDRFSSSRDAPKPHTAGILGVSLRPPPPCRSALIVTETRRRAYYSTFDRASSRRASTRRDASVARSNVGQGTLAGTTTGPAPRSLSRNIFLLVSVLTFVQAAPPLLLLTLVSISSAFPCAEIVPRLSLESSSIPRPLFPRERRFRGDVTARGLRVPAIDKFNLQTKLSQQHYW